MKSQSPASSVWKRSAEQGILPGSVDQTMETFWNRFRMDPVQYIEERHFLEYLEPQAKWVNGCSLGNGDFGALAYGPPEAALFSFGKTDLWDREDFGKTNTPAAEFSELREVLARKDGDAFDRIADATAEKATIDAPTCKPGGMLRLELYPASIPASFRQRLSFARAQVDQTWIPYGDRRATLCGPDNTVSMSSFVHAARNVFATHIAPGKDVKWHGNLRFTFWRDDDPEMADAEVQIDGNLFWIKQPLPGGNHFILMGTVDAQGFEITRSGGRVHGAGVPQSDTLTFYVTLVTSRESKDPLQQARQNLGDAIQAGFGHLEETHRKWWGDFWKRGFVATPWSTVERSWYYALYLQACACRPGCLSPGLQSNLVRENYPAWNADFHNNINMQIVYSGQYKANRLELAEPLYRLIWDVLPRCQKDTAAYFKMRGARYPIAMGIDGAETAPGILLSTWIGAGGWLAEHFWSHYQFSGDRTFLRDYAYPFLRECTLFYQDYLQEDAEGKLLVFPTIQMEIAVGTPNGAGENSAWDLPIVIRTFQLAVQAAAELKVDREESVQWQDILKRLPSIPVTADGVWKEFSSEAGLWHQWDWARFVAVYPHELVGKDHGPSALRDQAQKSIEEYYQYRKDPRTDMWCSGGFSGTCLAAALMRMGHAERALELAENICRQVNPSGFVNSREAAHFQVDAPMGFSIFVNEMLLQGHGGLIRVFPSAPADKKPVRFHSLRAEGGFLVTSERRENRTQYVIIQSLCGNPLRLLNPFINEPDMGVQVKVYRLRNKEDLGTLALQFKAKPFLDRIYIPGEIIEFSTEANGIYLVSKEIPWFSNIPVEDVS